jgi:hypothetical protein
MHGDGHGGLSPPNNSSTFLGGKSVLADVTGDGLVDVVSAFNGTVFVAPQRAGGFGEAATYTVNGPTRSFAACDLDGDGTADVVVAGEGGVTWLRGGSTGLSLPQNLDSGTAPHAVTCGDVDGDGRADVVAVAQREALVLRSLGGGHFGSPLRRTTQTDWGVTGDDGTVQPFVGDADGDGFADLIFDHVVWSYEEQLGVLPGPCF